MKKLSRDEMKNVMGGVVPPMTYVCGTESTGNVCFCDFCFGDGTPAQCHVPCYYTNCPELN